MNLIQAIESGRKFRRPGCVDFTYRPYYYDFSGFREATWSKEDFLATDWELEPIPEKTVSINRNQAYSALCNFMGHEWCQNSEIIKYTGRRPDFDKINKFIRELGFD